MSQEKIKSYDRLMKPSALVVGAFLTAALVQTKATIDNNRRPARGVEVISDIRPGMYSNWFFPGFHTDMRVVGPNFDRHWQDEGAAHYAVHEEDGHSMDARKEMWLKARKKDGFRPARFYAQSMGAMEVFDAFSDQSFAQDFGEVDTVLIDSGVSKASDITQSVRLAMAATRALPPLDVSDKIYHFMMAHTVNESPDHDQENVTLDEALAHLKSSTKTTFKAGRAQVRFIEKTDIGTMDLSEWGGTIRRKAFISAADDSVVNLAEATTTINDSLGGGMIHVIDTRRKSPSHASGAEHPRGVLDNLRGENQDDYRVVSIRPRLAQAAKSLSYSAT